MLKYAINSLLIQPARFFLSIIGIGLCLLLLLFLLASYNGVKYGAMEYIHSNACDYWVLQKNSSNILRCTSVLTPKHYKKISKIKMIEQLSPVLLLLTSVEHKDQTSTIYLAGYDLTTTLGGPPSLVEGRSIKSENEIILDYAYALKYGFNLGDTLFLQQQPFEVVGISDGTNAFVIQYAFISLEKARELVDFNVSTCYLLRLKPDVDKNKFSEIFYKLFDDLTLYDQATFVVNNNREMQTGFLPFILTIVGISSFVLMLILSLLLTIHILEQRKEYAILKMLGMENRNLASMVMEQSGTLIIAGILIALLFYYPTMQLVETLTPEITMISSLYHFIWILLLAFIIGIVSSIVALRRLKTIYALEVFHG